jgi:class 3 adenylate cyclase
MLITDTTRSLLSNPTDDWVERPAIPLKGKADPVRLFAPKSTGGQGPIGG